MANLGLVEAKRTFATAVSKVKEHSQSFDDFLKALTNNRYDVYQLLRWLCSFCKFIPYLGRFLALIEGILPDKCSEEVSRLLQNLGDQIRNVGKDVNELENKIKWVAVEIQYCDIVTKIETGVNYLAKIPQSTNDKRKNCEERLKELCSNQIMTLAVRSLLKGFTGEGLFQNDVLETIYCDTKGHRGKIESMCNRLLQLAIGGLSVIAAYETLIRGEEAAQEMMTLFEGETEKVKTRVEAFLQKCKVCFKENMLEDLNEVLDGDRSNKDAVEYLSKFMREKYDWLENYCVVCNKATYMNYSFEGNYVSSSGRNGMFGVVFYHDSTEAAFDEARQQDVDNTPRRFGAVFEKLNSAPTEYQKGIDTFRKKGFKLWGCAVIQPRCCKLCTFLFKLINIYDYDLKLATLQCRGSSSACTDSFKRLPDRVYLTLWR